MRLNIGWQSNLAIWRLTRRKTSLGDAIHKLARIYVEAYEDRGTYAVWNGEHSLLSKAALPALGFRTYFDVGANVGEWTQAVLAANRDARVHAFELVPQTAQTLMARFKETSAVVVNPFGLSDRSGTVAFRQNPADSRLSSIVLSTEALDLTEVGTAQVRSGNDYCAERGIESIDFLKIDAEGADHLVLKGFDRLLGSGSIRLIQFEYGYAATSTRFLVKDFVDYLARYNYRVAQLKHRGVLPAFYDWTWNNFESGPNFVAFRANDTSLIDVITTPS